ncbi:mapk phosphatase 2 [Stylonychia lemnae]|uniref:protein-tyrosine-phosphatase n=1 Tax=Stylonychia lemnae TaxID=5949 RepID=A0A078AQT3_STYLE|nr:mapk phosphatase 2 [Stylonychia lemnae]|eukprot:CDW83258.1 mapk phosphatase 2 [Stylonychia lemnae]
MDPSSVKKSKAKIKKLFSTKYTNEELESILQKVQSFDVKEQLPEILKPEANEECKKFLGSDNKITLTNVQQIVNQVQNLQGKVLILDTRSQFQFHLSHFENAINFPVNLCNDEFFTKWDPKNISDNIIKNKVKKELFEARRRMYVFIIASQNDITHYLEKLPKMFDPQSLENYINKYIENKDVIENLVSIRNALLLFKALKNERIREMNLCINGFNTFKQKYPHFCKFRTQFLYPKKQFIIIAKILLYSFIATTYPSEILEKRLYLGDHIHAFNLLQIYLAEIDIEYLKINIEDTSSVPIKLSFPVAFQFLDQAFNECKLLTRDKSKRNNALVDNSVLTSKELRERSGSIINSTALLTPIQADFLNNKMKRVPKHEELVAHKIDKQIDLFNRLSYNQNVVLVHCAMGVSRSASCVIMYIMKMFKLGFEDTLEFTRAKRHVVDPNQGFVQQLIEFEDMGMQFVNQDLKAQTALQNEENNSPSRNMMFSKRGRTTIFD